MIHSTKDAGPELRYQLYRKALMTLEMKNFNRYTLEGWTLIRALGKKILRNDKASDSECCEAIIMKGR